MEIFIAAEAGKLKTLKAPKWDDNSVVNVVMAAKGYPGSYKKGTKINGIENVEIENPEVIVFHAGTKRDDDGARRVLPHRYCPSRAEAKLTYYR